MNTAAFSPRQTNTGLYVQLNETGFSHDDIARAQATYRVVCRMFNGRVRKTERVFICHAVGSASAVAEFSDDIVLVLAAMLHAAYDSGLFPDGRTGGATRAQRKWLAERVGQDVEDVVFRYGSFAFDKGDPEHLLESGYREQDRDLLLIALAHELDDLMDLGLRFAPKYGERLERRISACAQLAEKIGQPALAAALQAGLVPYAGGQWVDSHESISHGYVVVPGVMGYLRGRFNHLRRKWVEIQ